MKSYYIFLLLCVIQSSSVIIASDNIDKKSEKKIINKNEDDSDRKFVVGLIEQLIFENVKMDNASETQKYAENQATQIFDHKTSFLNDTLRSKLNIKLLENIDTYNNFKINIKQKVQSEVFKNEQSNNIRFYELTYRERDRIVVDTIKELIFTHFIYDAHLNSFYKVDDKMKQNPISISDLDMYFK